MIEPEIDTYGPLARRSCLADYIEISALHGFKIMRRQLEDMIADRWGLKREIIVIPDDFDDDDYSEDSEDWGDSVTEDSHQEDPEQTSRPGGSAPDFALGAFECIKERARILGDKYPFDVSNNHVETKTDFDLRSSPYVGLLALTAVHAYGITTAVDPKRELEVILSLAINAAGIRNVDLGSLSRKSGLNFPKTVKRAGKTLGIKLRHKNAVHRLSQNDGGIDLIGFLDWGDGRLGRWSFVGQATCATSESWAKKMDETRPRMWAKIMGEEIVPQSFLAVPYHVEERPFLELLQNCNGSVVDRLRLVQRLDLATQNMQGFIDELLKTEVQQNSI